MTNHTDKTQHGGVKTGANQNQSNAKPDQGDRRNVDENRSGDDMRHANDTGAQRNVDENRSAKGDEHRLGKGDGVSERREAGAEHNDERPSDRVQDETSNRDAAQQSNERDREDREGARTDTGRTQQPVGSKKADAEHGRGQMAQNQQNPSKQHK